MNKSIFIPNKIKVGYCVRQDTFTGKLAYIIYFDHKGVLRKEQSWQNWRNDTILPETFDNTPVEGFVLNKKVGGYKVHWDARQTYVRVYDPRGFEFEISVPNLLYILENTNCIKGKGLEGEFVYGWDGTELLLIPTSAPDYENMETYSSSLFAANKKSLKGKDLILGATYLTNKNENVIYIARSKCYSIKYYNVGTCQGNRYFFYSKEKGYFPVNLLKNRILECVDPVPVFNYAELRQKIEEKQIFSPIDKTRVSYKRLTKKEIEAIKYTRLLYIKYDKNYVKVSINKYNGVYNYTLCKNPYYMRQKEIPGISLDKDEIILYGQKARDFIADLEKISKDGGCIAVDEIYPVHRRIQYLMNGSILDWE